MKKLLFFLLIACGSLWGQFANESENDSTERFCFDRLLADSIFIDKTSVKPGDTFSVLIELDLKENWKVYWKTSGGITFPMEFIWTPPKGITFEGIKYPYPKYDFDKFAGAAFYNVEIEGNGHTYHPTYIATFKVDKGATSGPLELGLKINWQACEKDGPCVQPMPASIIPTRKISINIADTSVENPEIVKQLNKANTHTPVKAPAGWKIHAYKTASSYKEMNGEEASVQPSAVITLVAPNKINPLNIEFFPNDAIFAKQANKYSFSTVNDTVIHKTFEIELTEERKTIPDTFSGVITIKNGDKTIAYSIDGIIEDKKYEAIQADKFRSTDGAPIVKAEDTSIWLNLVLAFFGGFILNLMPCVFPVLSIKVMGFVNQAQEGKSHAIKHALVFTAGALLTFWVLAGTMLALKAASSGAGVDWGFQLQKPYVVLTLVLVLFIMALNLFGLFEIGVGLTGAGQSVQHKSGMSGSFFSGILATVVATPCMAPMLGAALTYAFTQPAAIAMIIFTVICLGMCSPYIVLAMSPKLLKFIPKPGAWMETFKQSMGFLMMLAVIWLLGTLQKQLKYEPYLFNILWSFTAVAIACWVYGKYCPLFLEKSTRIKGLIATLIIGGFGLFYGYNKIEAKPALDWVVFDEVKLEELRRKGIPVFIDFTAVWCATCQVNKNLAIYPNAVLFKQKGVITMKADNTNSDPIISKWLAEFESPGVPLNLLYDGDDPIPIKFPESYTSGTMQEVLNRIPDKK
jgi:thiol:disulfide interchange protein/DsbC/DsbD-like thiol-disulfide interchange protein